MRLKTATVGILLVGIAFGSAAINLGRARGAAWIGQPLELTVPVQMDPGQTVAGLCAEADVFQADSKVDSSRVQVIVEPTANAEAAQIKVISTAIVEEPVVTVYLRSGCDAKTTRRYVLLADYPNEGVATAPRNNAETVAPIPTLKPAEAVALANSPPVTQTTAQPSASPAEASQAAAALSSKREAGNTAKAGVRPIAPDHSATGSAPTPGKPASVTGTSAAVGNAGKPNPSPGARLKLDPVESLAEKIRSLEASSAGTAAADEMARDNQRVLQLQRDVKALLEQSAKNEASLLAMREKLERAESDRFPAMLVYVLIALVLVCLAAIALLWTRRNDIRRWNDDADPMPAQTVPIASPAVADPVQVPASSSAIAAAQAGQVTADAQDAVSVNHVEFEGRSFSDFMNLDATQLQPVAPSATLPGDYPEEKLIHVDFNSESIFDLRQQADFFTKLGKPQQAIEGLETRIRVNGTDCPTLYLDLLSIASEHDLKTDFRDFREEFLKFFNANVPEFALFREEGRSLEAYAALTAQITALWSSPAAALDLLESCILRNLKLDRFDPFDLAAFKDLVFLHGIAFRHLRQDRGIVTETGDLSDQHFDLNL
jgi:hypothetical protein